MAPDSESPSVELTTPAKAEYVLLARLALSGVCRLTSLRAEDTADLKLAVTEAAAMRGGGQDRDERLVFRYRLQGDRLVIEVGGGAPSAQTELGRSLVQATVDECEFSSKSIRLIKLLE